MSWDVVLIKTEEVKIEDIEEPLVFPPQEIIIEIMKDLFPSINCTDLEWLVLDHCDYSIEFYIGSGKIECLMLHIRGNTEPKKEIQKVCDALHCKAFDCSTGELISPTSVSSFHKWKDYRDKILHNK